MLEIKNLKKVYVAKGKGGAKTNALDDVSITFPETGMVFLLGKSGSGKSTLLNVCGGLDTPTSGEVIVKGRSSKDFSKADFDSYRNTFIGFIFQEYNILDEFTVEDNIALALELQGKKKDKARIAQLLADVDLTDFAKRKPNTLSGGQKQRIAIARALIKEPEIIMADEPTGALDSNTGKQVFDTLKKLSETKLVIVVSHDRDFAEIYGDRIIELKDGKILSDITKGHTTPKEAGNITVIDDENLLIKQGTQLKPEDLKVLNNFLSSSSKEIFISKGEEEIQKYKTVAQISDNGSRDKFDNTDESKYAKKSYKPEDSKFIKSKLPAHHAFKIGTSNLKVKPFRLFFTELLTISSFVLVGLSSTMMFYNKEEVAINSLSSSDAYFNLSKSYRVTEKYEGEDYEYTHDKGTKFSTKDIEELEKVYDEVIPYYNFSDGEYVNISNLQISNSTSGNSNYYFSALSGFAFVKDDSNLHSYIIEGKYPTNNKEIMISKYTYESLKINTLRDYETNNKITLASPSDILNKTIDIRGVQLKVSGVFDIENLIPAKFDGLKEQQNGNQLTYEFEKYIARSLAATGFVSSDFYDTYRNQLSSGGGFDSSIAYLNPIKVTHNIKKDDGSGKPDTEPNEVHLLNLYEATDVVDNYRCYSWNGEPITSLSPNSFIIPLGNELRLDDYVYQYINDYDLLSNPVPSVTPTLTYNDAIRRIASGYYTKDSVDPMNKDEPQDIYLTDEERIDLFRKVLPMLNEHKIFDSFKSVTFTQENSILDPEVKSLVGFYFASNSGGQNPAIFTSEDIEKYRNKDDGPKIIYTTKYKVDKKATIDGVFVNNTGDNTNIQNMVYNHYNYKDDDSIIKIHNATLDSLDMANNMIDSFSKIFLYVGIALSVFAALLLFNFISVSINNKKREIGILRAVGARGTDVFKIFFSESFVITLIALVIGIVATFFAAGFANASLAKGLGGVKLLVFGWKSMLLIVGLGFVVMLVSTWLPVYFIAKKKPVDSIRSL